MLNNIKLIGVIFLSILLLTNCKKDVQDTQQPGELVFAAIDVNDTQKDAIDQFDIDCDATLTVDYAKVILNGITYTPATFMSEGKLLTQSIKLPVGPYTISEFSLMDDMDTPDDISDDKVVKSTPMAGSDFADYLSDGAAIDDAVDFTITEFVKSEFAVEVLCYQEAYYSDFGFEWFEVTEITIREQCFFGDFCIKDVNQYTQSLYGLNGVTIDEKAIFKIKLNKKDANGNYVYYAQFDNFENGEYVTGPLCVEYADYDATVDEFQAELWIYVTSGQTWDYVHFYTWNFKDAEKIEDLYGLGLDGVVDFVLGNCAADTPDLLLPPWMNLPQNITYSFNTSDPDSYLSINLGSFGTGYDIIPGTYEGWCADAYNYLDNSNKNSLSSLYPNLLPGDWKFKGDELGRANWLFNNLSSFAYLNYTATELQDALWAIFDNKVVYGNALTIAQATLGHEGFSPLPGGWAAILFIDVDYDVTTQDINYSNCQITFLVVDP